MSHTSRIVLAALAVALVAVVPAGSALVAPVLTSPGSGTTVAALPAFKWDPVEGAASYSFEFSGDPAFNSTHATVTTRNTRATLKTLFPNGTYYWRVRGLSGAGAVGDWSEVRELEIEWAANPALQAPADGATITYPDEALELKWEVVPGASKYFVKVATDPELGSLLWDGNPIKTAATQFTLSKPLAAGTYYWGIVPLDAAGHEGEPSAVRSFAWEWPSETTPAVDDLVAAPEVYDPQFAWDAVPGAAGYDVEINFSSDWTESSKVCCTAIKGQIDTLGTAFTPAATLPNNTYYWRVRAIDTGNNAGVWNEGPTFTKTFDNVPPVTAPAVKSLRIRDNAADPATDTGGGTAVVDTDTPVVAWDAVPGASGYNVMVTAYADGVCDWSASSNRWDKFTTVTAWTPLGWSRTASDPYPSGLSISTDANTGVVAGTEYCVRVRAVDRPGETSAVGPTVVGDWAYVPANNQPAFRWNGPPAPAACTPCTMSGSDYGRAPHRNDGRRHAALHLAADRRGGELLRAGGARPELHERDRLRLHPHPGLRTAPVLAVARVRGRDDALLLGGAPRRQRQRERRVGGAADERAAELHEAVRAAVPRRPGLLIRRRHARHGVLLAARPGRSELPHPGLPEPDVLGNAAHECRRRLDLVHEQQDVSGGHRPLLARAGRGRGRPLERRRSDLVGDRHVHEAAAQARARPGQSHRRRVPHPQVVAGGRGDLLRHPPGRAGRRPEDLRGDPRRRHGLHEDDGGRHLQLAGAGELPDRHGEPHARPVLAVRHVQPHAPRAGQPRRGDRRRAAAARLGSAPARGRVPRPDLDPSRLRHHGRDDDDADDGARPAPHQHRLHGRRHLLLARGHDRRRLEPGRLHGHPLVHVAGDSQAGGRGRPSGPAEVQGQLDGPPRAEEGEDGDADRAERKLPAGRGRQRPGLRPPTSRPSRRRPRRRARSASGSGRPAIRARSPSGSPRPASLP